MNRSVISLAVATVLSTISGTALAEGNYGSLNLGLSSIDGFSDNSTLDTGVGGIPLESAFDFKNSKSISGALGRRMSPNLRMEIELNYRKADMSSKLTSLSFGGSPAVEAIAPIVEGDILVPFSPATAYVPPVDEILYTQVEIDGLQAGASLDPDGVAYDQAGIDALIADDPDNGVIGSVRITGQTAVPVAFYTADEITALKIEADNKEDGTAFTQAEIDALIPGGSVMTTAVAEVLQEFYSTEELAALIPGDLQANGEPHDATTITTARDAETTAVTGGANAGETVEKVTQVNQVDVVLYDQAAIDLLQAGPSLKEDGTAFTQAEIDDLVADNSVRISAKAAIPEQLYTQAEINGLQAGASLKEDGEAFTQEEITALEAGTSVKITGQAEILAQDDAIEEVVAGPDDVVEGVEGVEADEPIVLTASERGIGDIESTTALINVYYDFTSESKFTPYMSLGAGMGWHTATISDYTITMSKGDEVLGIEHVSGTSAKDHAFAYQLGFGGSYEVAESTYLTAGYRHIGSAALNFDGIDADLGVHEINAGIRMEF